MADRYIEVSLVKRGITATAKLLDDRAPITCAAVWDALPLAGDVYHAKYARNEIYALFPPFAESEPPLENPTVTPIPGDLCYFSFAGTELGTKSYGYDREVRAKHDRRRPGPVLRTQQPAPERRRGLGAGDRLGPGGGRAGRPGRGLQRPLARGRPRREPPVQPGVTLLARAGSGGRMPAVSAS